MLLAKKDQYYKIISNHENNKFFNGFTKLFLIVDLLRNIDNYDYYVKAGILLIFIFFILCAFLGFIFPFMLFYLMKSFISQKKYLLVILSSINLISYIFVLLGFRGKIHCFCLYRPHQWIFFMIIFDMINLFSNCYIFVLINDKNYYEKKDDDDYFVYLKFGFVGSFFYSFAFIIIQTKIALQLITLFNILRTLETNVIKFCTFEYIKELKRKSEINN